MTIERLGLYNSYQIEKSCKNARLQIFPIFPVFEHFGRPIDIALIKKSGIWGFGLGPHLFVKVP